MDNNNISNEGREILAKLLQKRAELEALLDENGRRLLEEYDKLGEKLIWRLCDTAYSDGRSAK
ncbi:MAG: hypothetical protein IJW52_04300 [Clostridia bacterium]|nr:hypothetical protein [Clostridia bacterium]